MATDFLEKDLEDIIYKNRREIHAKGIGKLREYAFRQVILPSGKKIDMLAFDIQNGDLFLDIYELKRKVINAEAICQAFDYYTEIKHLTKSHFSTISAKIIMIARKYEPTSVVNALPIPIEIYRFDYGMDGIRFSFLNNPYQYAQSNISFSMGLWAFGTGRLKYGEDVSSIQFHSVFEQHSRTNPDFQKTLTSYMAYHLRPSIDAIEEVEINIELAPIIKRVETVVFPEQPQWSIEFAQSIPAAESIMDDIDVDLSDYEDDELDQDFSDFEPTDEYEENEPALIMEAEYRKSVILNSVKFTISESGFGDMVKNSPYDAKSLKK